MLLHQLLECAAERDAEASALVEGEARLDYGEAVTRAWQWAHALRSRGLARGERVLILLENGLAAASAIWATSLADGILVVGSPTLKAAGIARLIDDCEPRLLVTDSGRREAVGEALRLTGHSPTVLWADGAPEDAGRADVDLRELLAEAPGGRPDGRAIDVDLVALVYTSGSTGAPKGVMESHGNLVSVTRMIVECLRLRASDRLAGILPLNSGYGLSQLLTAAQVGAGLVFEPWSAFPFPMVETMRRESVTVVAGVPTLFHALLRVKSFSREGLPELRMLTNAGAGISPQRIAELRAAFPDAEIHCMYGQTECQRMSMHRPEEVDARPTSVGRGMPNQDHRVVGPDGAPVAPGAVGELIVRGSHVMRGYWRKPEESAERFRSGPVPGELELHTGDLFRVDEEGYLYFVSRGDDIIKSRGQKVSPKEVEDVLQELPEVRDAAVLPEPDEALGEAVVAHVELEEGSELTPQAIQRHCAARLEDYKVPKRVVLHDRIPRGQTGKLDRAALRG